VQDSQKVMTRLQYDIQYLRNMTGRIKTDSRTISSTSTEALINGPGVLKISGELYEPPHAFQSADAVNAAFSVRPAGSEVRASAEARATRTKSGGQDNENFIDWSLVQDFNGV
jgi:hypothetical protein